MELSEATLPDIIEELKSRNNIAFVLLADTLNNDPKLTGKHFHWSHDEWAIGAMQMTIDTISARRVDVLRRQLGF